MHTAFHVVWGVSKHIAFAYLVYSLTRHLRGESPTGLNTGLLLFGVTFPDTVDKLLVAGGTLSYGRAFAHSLLTMAFLIGCLALVARTWGGTERAKAFSMGYLLHVPVDMYGPLLTGKYSMDTAFLFWPVVVEYPLGIATPELPVARRTLFGVVIGSALLLWLYDFAPSLRRLLIQLGSRFELSRIGRK